MGACRPVGADCLDKRCKSKGPLAEPSLKLWSPDEAAGQIRVWQAATVTLQTAGAKENGMPCGWNTRTAGPLVIFGMRLGLQRGHHSTWKHTSLHACWNGYLFDSHCWVLQLWGTYGDLWRYSMWEVLQRQLRILSKKHYGLVFLKYSIETPKHDVSL